MPFISGDVAVRQTSPTEWKLIEPVIYQGKTDTFTVPGKTPTDFASVPRIFFWLFPSYGTYTKAAILHDYLCNKEGFPRDEADAIFRRAMRELGVPFLRRWMMWAAVRVGGHFRGTSPAEFAIWLAVAVPSIVFLFVPAIVVAFWLFLFWLIEYVFYGIFKVFAPAKKTKKQVNKPTLLPSKPVDPPEGTSDTTGAVQTADKAHPGGRELNADSTAHL